MDPSPNVLIIEDSKIVRSILSAALKERGFSITVAEDGVKGLALGQSGHFDLIIAGVGRPKPGGLEICKRLRQDSGANAAPIILLDEDGGEERAAEGFCAGAAAFIVKSRMRVDLIPKIRGLLGAGPMRGGMTFLVAEDSDTVRRIICEKLEARGFAAIPASGGRAALEELRARRPDVILCDARMPDMDAAAVFEAIQDMGGLGNVPFVVMGAEQEREAMKRIMGLGAAACLFKPFRVSQLVRLAEELRSEAFEELWTERRLAGASLDAATAQLIEVIRLRESRLVGYRRHSERTADFVGGMAKTMGMPEAEANRTILAARLHDLGRLGLPDEILLKSGKLTPAEYETVKRHSAMGAQMLAAIPSLADVVPAALHHHERMDGSGYPYQLRGTDIPLLARITAAADSFEALTSDRPYRRALSEEAAMRVLCDAKGAHCCPRCLKALAESRGLNQSPGPALAGASRTISREDRRSAVQAEPMTILVADAHLAVQNALKQGLRKLGNVEVILASTGEEAWKLINKTPFEAVVLAEDLPGTGGLDLASRLRWSEAHAQVPCVLTLSGDNPGLAEKVKAMGLSSLLVKPFSVLQLWERLTELAAERARLAAGEASLPDGARFPKELVDRLGAAHEDFCAHIGRRFLANLQSTDGEWGYSAGPEVMDKQKDVFLAEFKPLHLAENVMPLFGPLAAALSNKAGPNPEETRDIALISRRFLNMGMNVAFSHFQAIFPEDMLLAEKSNPFHKLVASFRKDAREALEAFDDACREVFGEAASGKTWERFCPPPDCSGFSGAKCDLHAHRDVMDAFGRGLLSPLDMRDAIADVDAGARPGIALFPRVFCAPTLKVIKAFFVGGDRYDSVNATFLELMKKYCGKQDGFAHYELRLFFSQDKVAGYLSTYILSILGILSSEEKKEMFIAGINGHLEQASQEGAPLFENRHYSLLTGTWADFVQKNLHRLTARKAARKILRRYIPLAETELGDGDQIE